MEKIKTTTNAYSPSMKNFRLRANGRNNSQHCCANNVGNCCVSVGSGVQTDATSSIFVLACKQRFLDLFSVYEVVRSRRLNHASEKQLLTGYPCTDVIQAFSEHKA